MRAPETGGRTLITSRAVAEEQLAGGAHLFFHSLSVLFANLFFRLLLPLPFNPFDPCSLFDLLLEKMNFKTRLRPFNLTCS